MSRGGADYAGVAGNSIRAYTDPLAESIRRNESYGGPGGHSAAVAEAPPDYGSRVRHSAVLPQSLRSVSAVLPQYFRTSSAVLPQSFRSGSAVVPQCFRSNPAIILCTVYVYSQKGVV